MPQTSQSQLSQELAEKAAAPEPAIRAFPGEPAPHGTPAEAESETESPPTGPSYVDPETHAREAFDTAKEAIASQTDDAHETALQAISAFLEHLAKAGETELGKAATTLKDIFDRIV